MNPGRTIAFILLSSLVLMTAIFLQNSVENKQQLDADGQPIAVAEDANAPKDIDSGEPANDEAVVDETSDPGDETSGESNPSNSAVDSNSADSSPGDQDSETDPTTEPETSTQDLDTSTGENSDVDGETAAPDQDPNSDAELQSANPAAIGKLITIGSLSETDKYRFLITANQRGGSIRRIELNAREKNGDFKYRDLEFTGGYFGALDCINTVDGCLIRCVGPGTPASIAVSDSDDVGLKADDIILALNGQPITNANDFHEITQSRDWLPPGEEAVFKIARGTNKTKKTFRVKMTEKPLEVVRPEPSTLDEEFVHPESFLMSFLIAQGENWQSVDPEMETGIWELETSKTTDGRDAIEFKYEVPADKLAAAGINGPLTAVKRYTLKSLDQESSSNLLSRSYHWEFELEIINPAQQTVPIGYSLTGPSGVTSETWWYQNKIHGRQTAIGYIAGSRDVIGSSEADSFRFLGGPEIVKWAKKEKVEELRVFDQYANDPNEQLVNYVGVDSQYFNVSLIPENGPYKVYSGIAYPTGGELPKNVRAQKLVNNTFYLYVQPEMQNGSYKQKFEVFSGPKEPKVLKQYGLGDAQTFGWFSWFSKPLLWLLHLFYWLTGKFTYAIPIIILTLMVRSIMLPISRKAALNAQMMQHLQPQIKEIADKYKDDMEKRSQAQRALFKKYNYNPFGGCFMMFFQLPIFIGLYRGLSVDIALRDQPLIPGMKWCSNLSAPDQFMYWKEWLPFGLAEETGWLGPFLNVLPLVTIVLFLAQQKLFMPPAVDDQQKMMQKVMTFMMIAMGVMFFKVPAGLCLYFITSSLWGIIERKMLPKPKLNTDKLPPFGDDGGGDGKPSKPSGPAPVLSNPDALEQRKKLAKDRQKRLRDRKN